VSDFGKKGGTGPTADATATRYTFTYPNGNTGTKVSFKCSDPTASAYVYEHGGTWYCVAVLPPNHEPLGHYIQVPAVRMVK
jgi:hypothetical protein